MKSQKDPCVFSDGGSSGSATAAWHCLVFLHILLSSSVTVVVRLFVGSKVRPLWVEPFKVVRLVFSQQEV